ncbi:udp-galactose transporter [Arthroderma uncinatum]|uniref:udp-galactose transporter n=1 Tax=Arthroderma uncinatum TaxID=74035 RepID=UPI00144AACF1|nr:udp-galactose transporter [Arthroderma uncinatum]KAF3490532.1 udp-galactose transporter [Arthroderma uncinatum]
MDGDPGQELSGGAGMSLFSFSALAGILRHIYWYEHFEIRADGCPAVWRYDARVMPVVGGHRYTPSTAVFLNEVVKLAIALTAALYELSFAAHTSTTATSLFITLSSKVFSGDSWKLAIPAIFYTISNSLQYVAMSNLEAARFQVTYQLKIIMGAIFAVAVLRRSLAPGKWAALFLLLAGVVIMHLQLSSDPMDPDNHRHVNIRRSLTDLSNIFVGRAEEEAAPKLTKRSATYEGIIEDMMLAHPRLNGNIGVLATIGACISSAFAGVSFERVLKDSHTSTSIWIRNVQLAIYSIFPALFIGVVFTDGEKIAKAGFFQGYNWVVWAVIISQAVGGIATSFCMTFSDSWLRLAPGGMSIVLSTLISIWFFEFSASINVSFMLPPLSPYCIDMLTHLQFILGTAIVLSAIYIFLPGMQAGKSINGLRVPPIRVHPAEKSGKPSKIEIDDTVSPPDDFSIKLPTTPLLSETGMSTSRPSSPNRHHSRVHSSRGSYFPKQGRDT